MFSLQVTTNISLTKSELHTQLQPSTQRSCARHNGAPVSARESQRKKRKKPSVQWQQTMRFWAARGVLLTKVVRFILAYISFSRFSLKNETKCSRDWVEWLKPEGMFCDASSTPACSRIVFTAANSIHSCGIILYIDRNLARSNAYRTNFGSRIAYAYV